MEKNIKTKRGLFLDLHDSDIIVHLYGYFFKFESEYRKNLFLKHYNNYLYSSKNIQINEIANLSPLDHDYFIFCAVLAYYKTQKKTLIVNINGDEIWLKEFTIRARIKIT